MVFAVRAFQNDALLRQAATGYIGDLTFTHLSAAHLG